MLPIARGGPMVPVAVAIGAGLSLFAGCPLPGDGGDTGFANQSDPANAGAPYVGSSSCRQCHANIAELHALHGHAQALSQVQGGPPSFPAAAKDAGVPNPPEGFDWLDVSWLVDGYAKRALFLNRDGFILTTGEAGAPTLWNLPHEPSGRAAGFADFQPDREEPLPFEFDDFRRRTTGPMPLDAGDPMFEQSRPGILGTWAEAGVQCEACHGPGGGHFTTSGSRVVIQRDRIYVDPNGRETCFDCHGAAGAGGAIAAENGFIRPNQQGAELLASGGHSSFSCTICHDPHRSVLQDRAAAIRNECIVCHGDMNMAAHDGAVYTAANGYTETLTCLSCHMPFATTAGSPVLVETFDRGDSLGNFGRVGDTRTHIFRIDSGETGFADMLTADGTAVRTNAGGLAAVTVDFVCLRCHNGQGNVFGLTVQRAGEIAGQMHANLR